MGVENMGFDVSIGSETSTEALSAKGVDVCSSAELRSLVKFVTNRVIDFTVVETAGDCHCDHQKVVAKPIHGNAAVDKKIEVILGSGLELLHLADDLVALVEDLDHHILLQRGNDVVVAAALQDFGVVVVRIPFEKAEPICDDLVHREIAGLHLFRCRVLDEKPAEGELGRFLTEDKVGDIATFVHKIGVGQDANSALELRVGTTGGSKAGGVGKIGVSSRNANDEGVFILDVVVDERLDLRRKVGIFRAVRDQSGKVNQGEVGHFAGADGESDGLIADVAGSKSLGAVGDLRANLSNIGVDMAVIAVEEHLWLNQREIIFESEFDGAASDDASALREQPKNASNELQKGGFAGGLATNDGDARRPNMLVDTVMFRDVTDSGEGAVEEMPNVLLRRCR